MFMHPATQKPFSPQMVRRMHNGIIQDAGIDHIRYVDLRHTCAILALKNGTDAKELAQMLGHYRPTITRQNYEPYLRHKAQKDERMRKSKYNSFDELPLMLTVEDVSHVLGIGLAHAYEVAHRRDFPTITLGSRIIVPRDKFMEWIDEQAAKKSEIL